MNTFSGFFADQFGFSAGLALTIVYVVSLGSLLAIQFIVGSDLISTTTGLPSVIAMLVMAGVIMSYILPAGLVAVLSTDVLRAIMMTFVLIVIVTVTAIYVPAYSALKEGFTPLPAADGIALLVLGFFGAVCAADVWQTILAAEGYRVVRNSLIIGAIAFMIIGVMIAGLGILTKSTIPELPVDTPAFVVAATRVIPGFLSPFLALMVTGSVMATADTEIWVISTVLVSNIFPSSAKGATSDACEVAEATDDQIRRATKVALPIVTGLALALAYFSHDAQALYEGLLSLLTSIAPVIVAVLLFAPAKANVVGGLWTGLVCFFGLAIFYGFAIPLERSLLPAVAALVAFFAPSIFPRLARAS